MWNTTHYLGPFYFHSITRSVLITQLFIGVAALSTLCLAAVVSEREAFAARSEGVSCAAGRRVLRRTAAARAQPPRRRPAASDGARLSAARSRQGAAAIPRAGRRALAGAEEELQLAIDELRELAHGIHPSALTTFGLAKAIPMVAARSTVPVEVVEVPSRRFAGATEAAAYYVIVEAITNAQKYAHASARPSAVRRRPRRHRGRDRRRRDRRRVGKRRLGPRGATRPDRGDRRQVRGREPQPDAARASPRRSRQRQPRSDEARLKRGSARPTGGADRAEREFERPDWGRVQGRQDVPKQFCGHGAPRLDPNASTCGCHRLREQPGRMRAQDSLEARLGSELREQRPHVVPDRLDRHAHLLRHLRRGQARGRATGAPPAGAGSTRARVEVARGGAGRATTRSRRMTPKTPTT